MKKIPSFSIITVFICLSIIGMALTPFLSIQLKPNRPSKLLNVSYSWPSTSAKVIEQSVTSKLEGLFNSVSGIKEISSSSKKGFGNIRLSFKKDVDMDVVHFEISNLIRQNYQKLPEGISYPRLSIQGATENETPILSYSLNANENPYHIKKYAESFIIPYLSKIQGINQVSIYGDVPYEWVITYDSEKLLLYDIDVQELIASIDNFFQEKQLGRSITVNKEKSEEREVSTKLIFNNSQEFSWEKIPVKKISNRILFLKDIASAQLKAGRIKAYYRVNGLNTLNIAIYADKGVNTINLSSKIKESINLLEKEILKDGYYTRLTQDKSEYLVKELNKIKKRALLSILVLLILTIVIYRNFKYLFTLFTSILVTILISIILYVLLDVELQLYSLAGITISFGIIIDNCIILMDHILTKKNKRAFLAILAATLTTIGSVIIIFLLEEEQRLNLVDFTIVIAINIGVSLLVSLYFIPAMLEKLALTEKSQKRSIKLKGKIVSITKGYRKLIFLLSNNSIAKWSLIALFIFGFGLPFHLFPEKINNPNQLGKLYNNTLGSEYFNQNIRPTLEKVTGGTLRLFTESVYENSYYSEPDRTSLTVSGKMPEGCTIEQLNEVIQKMERYISSFEEVSFFETQITSYRNSVIQIYFKEAYELSAFPYKLKNLLKSKALGLGGVDWFIAGVGKGFSNALGTETLGDRITLQGYNYDQLYEYAEVLREDIIKSSNARVKDAEITSERWSNSSAYEYYLSFNSKQLSLAKISELNLYSTLNNTLHSSNVQPIVHNNELQEIKVASDQYLIFNVWSLTNTPLTINDNLYKLNDLASVEKKKVENTIRKKNQLYTLNVAYDFTGPYPMANKFKERKKNEFKGKLLVGYKIEENNIRGWDKSNSDQYYYLFAVIGIIFLICSVLLESLRQPFAIIFMIPISFIGVFLTFYFFNINFDQGGYASFILLSGITVNSALYIINDFNNVRKDYPRRSVISNYLKAFNVKITPILLTIITTICGLLPFVWEGQNEVFWFSFAAGSIGGLIFSIIGLLIYLPLFLKLNKA